MRCIGENDAARLAFDEAVRAGLPVEIKPMFIVAADTRAAPALEAAERKSGAARSSALRELAKQVDVDAKSAKDGARVRAMAGEMRRLAAVQ